MSKFRKIILSIIFAITILSWIILIVAILIHEENEDLFKESASLFEEEEIILKKQKE